jgi:isoquinoline 1-oxidoreductase alpha subunit
MSKRNRCAAQRMRRALSELTVARGEIGCYKQRIHRDPRGVGSVAIEAMVNGKPVSFAAEPDTPLLWAIREELGMTGTKFGCGIAACGACSVHIDGEITRSCSVPISDVAGKAITTIEGLSGADGTLTALQQAWITHQVPQCGYCQSGQIMAAAALLAKTPKPTDADIDAAMTNICRCGTYPRIRAAIHDVAGTAAATPATPA